MHAEPISPQEALAMGLVDEVASGDQFRSRVNAIAAELAAGPTRAFAMSRELMDRAAALPFDHLLDIEAGMQLEAGETADHRNAVAALLEKRSPQFEGR
jgi:2-(1,2-epoxy-1,2-dihydrophenyl)acetyl-CoA isomerase